MKLWYKKKKITLQDMSLSNPQGSKGPNEEVPTKKVIAVPNDMLDEESMVE